MRPYVPPSTRPFSVNLYLGRIRVMAGGWGVLEPLAQGQEKDTYLWAGYLEKNMRGRTEADLLCSLLRPLNAQQKKHSTASEPTRHRLLFKRALRQT